MAKRRELDETFCFRGVSLFRILLVLFTCTSIRNLKLSKYCRKCMRHRSVVNVRELNRSKK